VTIPSATWGVCDKAVHYSLLGQIYEQMKNLPDGIQVNIKQPSDSQLAAGTSTNVAKIFSTPFAILSLICFPGLMR